MEILSSSKKYSKSIGDDFFISYDQPSFFVNKGYYDVITSSNHKFTDLEINEIAELYKYNYRIGKSNNTLQVNNKQLNDYIYLDTELLTIHKDNLLIGSMVSFFIPILVNIIPQKKLPDITERFDFFRKDIPRIQNESIQNLNIGVESTTQTLIFGCSTNLVLSKKNRGKGLGMAIIQESLQILYKNGGLAAYFVNTVSRCVNSITLYVWYYPLNIQKLDQCQFDYDKQYKHIYKSYLSKENETTIYVNEKNFQESFEFLVEYGKGKKFYFSPSFEYWKKWIKVFPTFITHDQNNKINGLFSFNNYSIWYPRYRSFINTGYLIFSIGKILREAILQAKKLYDMLIIYQVTDIESKDLVEISAQRGHKSFVNFFNTTVTLLASEFYSPIL